MRSNNHLSTAKTEVVSQRSSFGHLICDTSFMMMKGSMCNFPALSFVAPVPLTSRSYADHRSSSVGVARLTMAAPKNVRRTNEIKRLTEQLEKLREQRERMLQEKRATADSSASTGTNAAPSPNPAPGPSTGSSVSSVSLASPSSGSFKPGKHSSKSRFLGISSVDSEEYQPRVLLVAGSVPNLTTEVFQKTPSVLYSREPSRGNLFLSRFPEGFDGGFIALPTEDALANCGDPVVVLIPPELLSEVKLPITAGDKVVLVVDRAVAKDTFEKNFFYAWDVNGKVEIGWVDQEPAESEAKRLGRVVFGVIETDVSLRREKSCWEEENETYT